MKKLIIASLFSTVAFAGATHAQTATPEAGTTAPAAQTAGEEAAGGEAAMMNDGGFLTYQEGSQLLGSGLMGADVQGPDGESIGTVDDLVLDTDGQIQAVVVGVGGFLGIGAKDVAIMNDRLEFVLAQDAEAAGGVGAEGTSMAPETAGDAATPAAPAETGAMGATTTAPAGGATGTSPTTGATGTAGTMGTAAPATGETGAGMGWSGAGIDHIRVDYTREQLEEAPEFESAE